MTEPAASFWLDRAGSWQPPDPGVLPARADVVVIGGGMTGLRAAQRAAVLGAHVVLLLALLALAALLALFRIQPASRQAWYN